MLTKYRFLSVLLLLSAIFCLSCEKGEDMIKVDSTVYIPNSGLSTQTALLGESVFKLGVYKAGITSKDASVTVSMGVDQQAFTTFLATNPGYELLPSANYIITSPEITIGKERADLDIRLTNITESTFTGKKYVLPVRIKSTSPDVKMNAGKQVAFLYFSRFRNVYESKYKAYGQVVNETGAITKIDEVQSPVSVSANALDVSDAATGLKLRLTIMNNKVLVTGAPGFEGYNVQNNPAKGESTYVGQFDPVYQTYKGTFKLFYSYTSGGKLLQAAVELSFTL